MGTAGGDVVANLNGQTWAIQSKYRSGSQTVGAKAVDEVAVALGRYGAEVAVVANQRQYLKRRY